MAVQFWLPRSGKDGLALAATIALVGLAAFLGHGQWAATGAQFGAGGAAAGDHAKRPPVPEPQILKPLSPAEAQAENSAVPLVPNGIERAPPFVLADDPTVALGSGAALDCLTAAVYYEAAGESEAGQKAVAQVVLNRVRHPAFPPTVCGVVYQGAERTTGCQFTFTCDGSLARPPQRAAWDRARRIALAALSGSVEPTVGMATHYHAGWVVPYWAPGLDKIAAFGGHIFYRWRGSWGRRPAFAQRYAGEELVIGERVGAAEADIEGRLQPIPAAAAPTAISALRADALATRPIEDEPKAPPAADEGVHGLLADENPARLKADETIDGL